MPSFFIPAFPEENLIITLSRTIIYNKEDLRQLHLKDGLTFEARCWKSLYSLRYAVAHFTGVS